METARQDTGSGVVFRLDDYVPSEVANLTLIRQAQIDSCGPTTAMMLALDLGKKMEDLPAGCFTIGGTNIDELKSLMDQATGINWGKYETAECVLKSEQKFYEIVENSSAFPSVIMIQGGDDIPAHWIIVDGEISINHITGFLGFETTTVVECVRIRDPWTGEAWAVSKKRLNDLWQGKALTY